jgi:aryl-alcohol dehydrogenase-like predicted oxidoreductase
MNNSDFTFREMPALNKRVHRLGLAFNNGIEAEGIEAALDRGVNYLFWLNTDKRTAREVVRAALKRDRERYVFAGGASLGFIAESLRRAAERLLRSFELEYIDVFQLYWLGKMALLTKSVERELVRLREEGLVRAIGVSIHDRKHAAKLAVESPLDLLMVRYNAAHTGAETDIFPSYAKRRPLTVAYTATSWRKLITAPEGWDGRVMSPGDCYRFCLSSPFVDVVLSAADNRKQMEENLDAMEKGPLSPEENEWIRRYGEYIHGIKGLRGVRSRVLLELKRILPRRD